MKSERKRREGEEWTESMRNRRHIDRSKGKMRGGREERGGKGRKRRKRRKRGKGEEVEEEEEVDEEEEIEEEEEKEEEEKEEEEEIEEGRGGGVGRVQGESGELVDPLGYLIDPEESFTKSFHKVITIVPQNVIVNRSEFAPT